MQLDILSSQPYQVSYSGSLLSNQDKALNDVCGKTIGKLSFKSATTKMFYLLGKYVLETV